MAATGDQLVVVSKALTRMLQCVLALHDTHALEFSPFMSEFLHHYVDMIIAYDPSQQARRLLFVSSMCELGETPGTCRCRKCNTVVECRGITEQEHSAKS
jgi:hypothetical protein